MSFKQNSIPYVMDVVTSFGGGVIELGKEKKTIPGKDKWETLDYILLMPLVGVNHRQPILHVLKIMVHCHSIDKVLIHLQLVT